jgi:hypothetical protein
MSFASLDCDRLQVTLALGAASGRAARVRAELHDALESDLAPALAPFADGIDDGSVLFIERLDVEAVSGNCAHVDAVVRVLAGRIARAVTAEIDGGRGVRFRDREDFVAAFLVALADGSAWSQWWFEEFDGLRPLSTSNALRTVVLREDHEGLRALGRLTTNAARQIIDALQPADAARIVAAMRARADDRRLPAMQLWKMAADLDGAIDAQPRRWLAALLACERELSGGAGEASVRALQGMRLLRSVAFSGDRLSAKSELDRPREALFMLASRCGVPLDWIGELTDSDARGILAEILEATPQAPDRERHWTSDGGAFLLMARLARLDWFHRWRGLLDDADARALALAIVATALAPAEAKRIAREPALLRAFHVEDISGLLRRRRCAQALALIGVCPERVRRRAHGAIVGGKAGMLLTGAARVLLDEFATRLPGLAGSTPDYLRANLLNLGASVEMGDGVVQVTLGPAPLDVLLTLAGCKRSSIALPGADAINLCGGLS